MLGRDATLVLGDRTLELAWCQVEPTSVGALSAREREGWARSRTEKRRQEYCAGRRAAHAALARLVPGLAFEVLAEEGGPRAGCPRVHPDVGLAVSVSHAGGWAVAVAGRGEPLGVDLERAIERPSPAFLEEAFAQGELEGMAPLPAEGDPVAAAWALKEAVLKVWGVGLRVPLTQVRLVPEVLGGGGVWQLHVELGAGWPGAAPEPLSLFARVVVPGDGWVLAVAG